MNIYIVENNKIIGTNTYPDVDDADCIVVDGVRSELEDVDQVDDVYYYEKINADKSITNYTTVTKVANFLGWQNNTVAITDTEVSDLNGWTYLKGYAPKKSLEEFKEEKLKELSSKASQFEQTENKNMFFTSVLGFRVNADSKAKRNIDTLIELQVQTFRDYDNVIHNNITVQDLETIKREISLNAVNLYNQKWTIEAEIKSLETIEAVKNYEIKFEMLNFTK